MPATYVFDLPQQMIEQAGGINEGDVIRYVGADNDTGVVMVVEVRSLVLLDDRPAFRITAELLPESRAGEAKLEAKVSDEDSFLAATLKGLDG